MLILSIVTLILVYVKQNTLSLVYIRSMKTLGENIKYYRKINNISQTDFAKKLNTTQQRVSEWECNKIEPSLYNIVKILNILNITFDELIDGIDI